MYSRFVSIQTFIDYSYIEKSENVKLLPKEKGDWDDIKFVSTYHLKIFNNSYANFGRHGFVKGKSGLPYFLILIRIFSSLSVSYAIVEVLTLYIF